MASSGDWLWVSPSAWPRGRGVGYQGCVIQVVLEAGCKQGAGPCMCTGMCVAHGGLGGAVHGRGGHVGADRHVSGPAPGEVCFQPGEVRRAAQAGRGVQAGQAKWNTSVVAKGCTRVSMEAA